MSITLENIDKSIRDLENQYNGNLVVNNDLNRTLVSFQASKKQPFYRWYKFKEGYSSSLVKYILNDLKIKRGKLIDPFAGSGTSLFAASEIGIDAVGIEIMPIGQELIKTKKLIQRGNRKEISGFLKKEIEKAEWKYEKESQELQYVTITKGAYPIETEQLIGKFLNYLKRIESKQNQKILKLALLCVLEDVSFTSKDGQFLRWDYRSGRGYGKNEFDKRLIIEFNCAIKKKLQEFLEDVQGENKIEFENVIKTKTGNIKVLSGSCLTLLKKFEEKEFDVLVTSPPYCNRYDYTRTYALELAMLDINETKLRELRQTMLSCTVENKDKLGLEKQFSDNIFNNAKSSFEKQKTLQLILEYLEEKKKNNELNNKGIYLMIKNYFFELSLIIFESARIIKSGGYFVMVNDNVRYAGAHIPVDLILSDIAIDAGFKVEKIWVLPVGKGNSSQQMGKHGREELRKCVYIWKKL